MLMPVNWAEITVQVAGILEQSGSFWPPDLNYSILDVWVCIYDLRRWSEISSITNPNKASQTTTHRPTTTRAQCFPVQAIHAACHRLRWRNSRLRSSAFGGSSTMSLLLALRRVVASTADAAVVVFCCFPRHHLPQLRKDPIEWDPDTSLSDLQI